VFQQCQSKDLWKTKLDTNKQVLIKSLETVLDTLCSFLLRLLKVAPSYFQKYLVGYGDKHFEGYEDLIFLIFVDIISFFISFLQPTPKINNKFFLLIFVNL